jgi:hypothetical protein
MEEGFINQKGGIQQKKGFGGFGGENDLTYLRRRVLEMFLYESSSIENMSFLQNPENHSKLIRYLNAVGIILHDPTTYNLTIIKQNINNKFETEEYQQKVQNTDDSLKNTLKNVTNQLTLEACIVLLETYLKGTHSSDKLKQILEVIANEYIMTVNPIMKSPTQKSATSTSVAESVPESVAESLPESVPESVAESVPESVAEPIPESVAETVSISSSAPPPPPPRHPSQYPSGRKTRRKHLSKKSQKRPHRLHRSKSSKRQ